MFFELDDNKRKEILMKYGNRLGVGIEFLGRIKTKRYCTLIYIKDVKEIEPFQHKRCLVDKGEVSISL